MYREQIDQVNENLLYEIEEKEEVKELDKETKNIRKEAKKVVKANKKVDKLKDEFRQQLKGINEDEFPDLLRPSAPVAFNPNRVFSKPSPDKVKEEPVEETKKVDNYDELEAVLKKNNELHKKHKFDPTKEVKPNVAKKKKKENKKTLKKEEFPGLPG